MDAGSSASTAEVPKLDAQQRERQIVLALGLADLVCESVKDVIAATAGKSAAEAKAAYQSISVKTNIVRRTGVTWEQFKAWHYNHLSIFAVTMQQYDVVRRIIKDLGVMKNATDDTIEDKLKQSFYNCRGNAGQHEDLARKLMVCTIKKLRAQLNGRRHVYPADIVGLDKCDNKDHVHFDTMMLRCIAISLQRMWKNEYRPLPKNATQKEKKAQEAYEAYLEDIFAYCDFFTFLVHALPDMTGIARDTYRVEKALRHHPYYRADLDYMVPQLARTIRDISLRVPKNGDMVQYVAYNGVPKFNGAMVHEDMNRTLKWLDHVFYGASAMLVVTPYPRFMENISVAFEWENNPKLVESSVDSISQYATMMAPVSADIDDKLDRMLKIHKDDYVPDERDETLDVRNTNANVDF